jgi:hypothetical protein
VWARILRAKEAVAQEDADRHSQHNDMNHAVRHPPLPGSGGIYHRILNAESRGDLITVCNRLGLTGQAAEVGVFRGHFARHNLELWHGKTYYLIDAWAFRANDTLDGKVSRDKNSLSAADHDVNYGIARARVLPWVENGTAVMIRRFAEAAVLTDACAEHTSPARAPRASCGPPVC